MKDAKLILLREENRILSLLLSDGNLIEMNAYPVSKTDGQDTSCPLGSVYVGKVSNVVSNIGAAFVELSKGKKAFLPLSSLRGANLLNRTFDGRILAGDEILVQVSKEAVKTKDPVITTEISLPGRYAVAIPGVRKGKLQFSGKLDSALRQALTDYLQENTDLETLLASCSFIIRTNAGELTDFSACAKELFHLAEYASHLMSTARTRTCYSCLYRPVNPYLTEIRDTCASQYEEILTDDVSLYEEMHAFLETSYPEELSRLRLYRDERLSLRNLYRLDSRMQEALNPRVWLRSGGYLVIEPTEALTVIDVNSGKYSARKGSRETFLQVNLEAAAEIARQLRLRNLSGIILVDFINMPQKEDEDRLLSVLSQELKMDPLKAVLIDMTPLGLVEITRKKVRRTLREQLEATAGEGIN